MLLSNFDDSSNPQLFSPPDLSTFPGIIPPSDQEFLVATGESCSAGMMNSPILRRDGFDWIRNYFKGHGGSSEDSPKVCPAPSSSTGAGQSPEPRTETKDEGPNGGNDNPGICGDNPLLCCRDDVNPSSILGTLRDLEQCWDCELITGGCGYRED